MPLKTLPSLREKKRYIVFLVHSEGPLQYHSLKEALIDSVLEFLGEKGLADANVRLVKNLWSGKAGFLQTNPRNVDNVKFSLALIHQIADQKVSFQTLGVSGTIKGAKRFLKRG